MCVCVCARACMHVCACNPCAIQCTSIHIEDIHVLHYMHTGKGITFAVIHQCLRADNYHVGEDVSANFPIGRHC